MVRAWQKIIFWDICAEAISWYNSSNEVSPSVHMSMLGHIIAHRQIIRFRAFPMTSVLVCFLLLWHTLRAKAAPGGKGLLGLQVSVYHWEKSGQECKAGAETEVMEEDSLLACSHGLLSLLSYITLQPRTNRPRVVPLLRVGPLYINH